MRKNNKTININDKLVEKRELCAHLYSDYYTNNKGDSQYILYNQHNIAYPKKFVEIELLYSKIIEVDPFIIILLEMIEAYKGYDLINNLVNETKTDKDILEYALTDFIKHGFVGKYSNTYRILPFGLELIEKRKKREIFKDKVIMEYDMVRNEIAKIYEANDRPKVKRKNSSDFELHYNIFRPDKYSLDDKMPNGNIYRRVLYEKLRDFYNKREEKSEDVTIENIDKISIYNDVTYDFYYTLFYINKDSDEKYLVIDEDNEIDETKTKYINECHEKGFINLNMNGNNKSVKEEIEKHEKSKKSIKDICNKGLDIAEGKVIQQEEHVLYLKEALKTANTSICITSPWIRDKVLEKYKKDIENTLERKVSIYINYGIEKGAKNIIDDKAKNYLYDLCKKYKNLYINSNANTHEKILICDDRWVITGSFNWLSYDGSGERREISTLNINKTTIDTCK